MRKEAPGDVVAEFDRQAAACDVYGSPFTARVLRALPRLLGGDAFSQRIAPWPGEARGDALALRCAGALHALARDGRCAALRAAYPPGDGGLEAGLIAALDGWGDWLAPWLESAPQTNEVGRSAIVYGGALAALGGRDMALDVMELGASAGLNLFFDRHGADLGGVRKPGDGAQLVCDWRGAAPRLRPVTVARRAGVDLNPIDPGDAAARQRLFAYVWPDQPARIRRLQDALSLASGNPAPVAQGDAGAWLTGRLEGPPAPGRMRFVFHTIARQYMPAATTAAIDAALRTAGARATEEAPLACLSFETDGAMADAPVTLTTWPGGEVRRIARACYHGRFMIWD